MSNESIIKCPNCGSDVNINNAFASKLEDDFNIEVKEKREQLSKDIANLAKETKMLNSKEELFEDKVREATKLQVKAAQKELHDKIKKQVEADNNESMELLQKELNEKSTQIQELNRTKIENEKLKRENLEIEQKIKADVEEQSNKNLENALDKMKEDFNKKLSKTIEDEKLQLEKDIKASLVQQNTKEIQAMQKQLEAKSEELQKLESFKTEIAKLKMEKQEIELKAKSKAEQEFYEKLIHEKQKAVQEVNSQNELKLKEKDEQLEQIKRKLSDTQKQVEQGSMQIQGEAQEHAIENWLDTQFKFDTIEEIGKGAFGADCVQTVNTRELQNCGKICYESKNTKEWSNNWIPKLKQDMLRVNADIGVLVTQAMPKDMDRMGLIDGIWVCGFEEFKGSSALLRNSLIELKRNSQSQENKTDKMNILYNYLSGNEFGMQMSAIVDGFTHMQTELEKQKKSNMASWKRQQKHIDSVLINTTEMYGSIKGIAGNAISNVKALELDYLEDEE